MTEILITSLYLYLFQSESDTHTKYVHHHAISNEPITCITEGVDACMCGGGKEGLKWTTDIDGVPLCMCLF